MDLACLQALVEWADAVDIYKQFAAEVMSLGAGAQTAIAKPMPLPEDPPDAKASNESEARPCAFAYLLILVWLHCQALAPLGVLACLMFSRTSL